MHACQMSLAPCKNASSLEVLVLVAGAQQNCSGHCNVPARRFSASALPSDIASVYCNADAPLATGNTYHHNLKQTSFGQLRFCANPLPFLHSYPHWVASYHARHAAKKHEHSNQTAAEASAAPGEQRQTAAGMTTGPPADIQATSPDGQADSPLAPLPADDASAHAGGPSEDPAAAPHVVSTESVRGTTVQHLSDGSHAIVLSEGVTGLVATSQAESEVRAVVAEVVATSGETALAQSPVARALAGAFGRLERQEHEAFLQMRTVQNSVMRLFVNVCYVATALHVYSCTLP